MASTRAITQATSSNQVPIRVLLDSDPESYSLKALGARSATTRSVITSYQNPTRPDLQFSLLDLVLMQPCYRTQNSSPHPEPLRKNHERLVIPTRPKATNIPHIGEVEPAFVISTLPTFVILIPISVFLGTSDGRRGGAIQRFGKGMVGQEIMGTESPDDWLLR